MSSHYAVIDGKYPWGISPLGYGIITGIWKFLILFFWLIVHLEGYESSFSLTLLFCLIPEIILAMYEFRRNLKIGWIQSALLNTMHSAGMVVESRPLYRTIFGYNKIAQAPIFYVDRQGENFILIFEPNGCPNATRNILPILQQELSDYEIIPKGNLEKRYLIRKRRTEGQIVNDEDFYDVG